MNREQKIQAIREKVVQAVPDIMHGAWPLSNGREIRLADVLVAHAHKRYTPNRVADFTQEVLEIVQGERAWNLRKNSLTDQSDECIDFLYEILK